MDADKGMHAMSGGMAELSYLEDLQAGIIAFLTSPFILSASGDLYSWANPAHPGFIYPEAMGLYLTLISQFAAGKDDAVLAQCATAVAARLQTLVTTVGGIGIHGRLYSFDTCMAIVGLLTYNKQLGKPIDARIVARMAQFIVDMAHRRLTVINEDWSQTIVEPRWSTAFGASMLKEVIALDALAQETGESHYRALAMEIADEVIRTCYADGAFHILPREMSVYSHAHCYALEGLLYLHACGYRDASAVLRAGADRLQDWQNKDGSLFNWYNAPSQQPLKVVDATAQAVRIWLAVDRQTYLPQIEAALSFLISMRSPQLGLYYRTGSLDVNSIASIFAAQAIEWYMHGVRIESIV